MPTSRAMKPMPTTSVQIDSSVISWLLGVMGTVVLFFLSLGIKDIRDRLNRHDELVVKVKEILFKCDICHDGLDDLKQELQTLREQVNAIKVR